MLRLALIGAGYWGKNLARNALAQKDGALQIICDRDPSRVEWMRAHYPHLRASGDWQEVIADAEIEAVLVATPPSSHFEIVRAALSSGKHCFVEKPLAISSADALALHELAKEKNLILAVDHTFLFTGAVRKIKELIDIGELGRLRYFDSSRINLGLIQSDVNVIYDLAAHDVSILNYLTAERPNRVTAIGKSYVTANSTRVEEVAHMMLDYPSGFLAHIHTSWLSPVKMRKILLGGDKKMVVYDDIEVSEKVRVHDSGAELDFSKETPAMPFYRRGDVYIPKLDEEEALKGALEHFLKRIKEPLPSIIDGYHGYETVKILEACDQSLKNGNLPVSLSF